MVLPLHADLTGELVCMQEVHRYFRCMAYDEAELRLIIVGDNGQAGKASSSQQLASALSVSMWDVSSMLRPVMACLSGKRQVHLQPTGRSNACSPKTAPHLVAGPVCPGLGCNCLCVMSTVASLSCAISIVTGLCNAWCYLIRGERNWGCVYTANFWHGCVVGGSEKLKHVADTSAETKSPACADSIIKPARLDMSKHIENASAETKPPAVVDDVVEPANLSLESIS